MAANTLGYTPERAEVMHNSLDRQLGFVEDRVRRLKELVPGTATIADRLDAATEEIKGVVTDLHEVVDERTDRTEW